MVNFHTNSYNKQIADHPILRVRLVLPRLSIHSLTHWGQDKIAAITQTTFSNAFSWMTMYEFRLSFHWNLFLMCELTIFQRWFRQWLGADQATRHYLNQSCLVYWCIHGSLGVTRLALFYFIWHMATYRCLHVCTWFNWYLMRSVLFLLDIHVLYRISWCNIHSITLTS